MTWTRNHDEYETCIDGHWGFVEPSAGQWLAFDGRFPRTEFGKGFLGVFATAKQAMKAVELALNSTPETPTEERSE